MAPLPTHPLRPRHPRVQWRVGNAQWTVESGQWTMGSGKESERRPKAAASCLGQWKNGQWEVGPGQRVSLWAGTVPGGPRDPSVAADSPGSVLRYISPKIQKNRLRRRPKRRPAGSAGAERGVRVGGARFQVGGAGFRVGGARFQVGGAVFRPFSSRRSVFPGRRGDFSAW